MKYVYAVMNGENGEGGRLVSIHLDLANAVQSALAVKTCFEGGWKPRGDDFVWENGCDFVKVEKCEVEP